MNETTARSISEAASKVGGKVPKQKGSKLFRTTEDLIKRQQMKVTTGNKR